jgi:two-component system sensor histidine kinase QseC
MNSIRVQIRRSILTGIVLLGGITGSITYFSARHWLTAEFDNALSSTARSLAMVTRFADGKVEIDFEDELMPEFERASSTAFFHLRLASGETVEQSPSLRGAGLPLRFGGAGRPAFWNLTLPNGREGRAVGIVFVPEPADERNEAPSSAIPAATLVIARDRTTLDRSLFMLRALLIGAGLISVGGILVIVNRAVIRGLLPLAEVGERSARIDASTLDARFPIEQMPAELRPICERLNDLLARLEKAFERERRFSSDVAHELRTPLAELRSLAEVALRWPGGDSEAVESFRDALGIAQQMESVVVALLTIARSEQGRQSVVFGPIDLAELVEETWGRFTPLAAGKRLAVAIDLTPDTIIQTDRNLLRIVLENLFSNTVDYTPDGGRIHIAIRRDEGCVQLAIENTTSDLQPADLPQLFERFWRKDNARTDGNHAGLGLSITRELGTLLGAEISAAMPSPPMLEVSLKLPGNAAGTEIRHAPERESCAGTLPLRG